MPDGARSGWRRAGAPLIVGLFLLIMAGSGILDLVSPAPGPALTDMDRRDRDQERAAANVADGSLMTYLDRELQEHSNVRETLVPWYIAYALLPMREGGSGVMVGKDGWLFLKDRIRPRGGTHRPSHARLAANILTAYDRRVTALGVRTVFLPLPRKATIATPFIPDGIATHGDYERDMLALLSERSIPHVNLYDVWEGVDPARIWQREDTHWSPLGMWFALEAGARALGYWVPPEERISTLEPEKAHVVKRQLLMTLGIPNDHPVLSTIPRERLVGPVVRRASLRKLPDGEPGIVLVGTSFSDTPSAGRQLAHLSNRRVLNLARGGTKVGITLEEALTSGKIPQGTPLLVEVPAFQLQGLGFGSSGPELLNSSMVQPLCFAEPPAWTQLAARLTMPRANRGELAARALATSGDAIVHLELTGKPASKKNVHVTVMVGGTRLTVHWRPELDTLHIPIITADTDAHSIAVTIQGAGVNHSIAIGLVTELDLEHPVLLTETPITSDAVGWAQERTLPQGALDSRHAALWIDLAPKGPAGPLKIELLDADGHARSIATLTLRPTGTALLRLSAVDGAWTTLRIKGSGVAPKRIGHVRIVDLPAR